MLNKLKFEIPKYINGNFNDVSEIAIELAKIIPEQDFIKMFNSQKNYLYKGKWQGNVLMRKNLNDLSKNNLNILGGNSLDSQQSNKLDLAPDCDCNWTCGGGSGTYKNGDCIITVMGCGFCLL